MLALFVKFPHLLLSTVRSLTPSWLRRRATAVAAPGVPTAVACLPREAACRPLPHRTMTTTDTAPHHDTGGRRTAMPPLLAAPRLLVVPVQCVMPLLHTVLLLHLLMYFLVVSGASPSCVISSSGSGPRTRMAPEGVATTHCATADAIRPPRLTRPPHIGMLGGADPLVLGPWIHPSHLVRVRQRRRTRRGRKPEGGVRVGSPLCHNVLPSPFQRV